LTEVFGRSNAGKTQLAMQAVLVAAREGRKSLFIDTEGAFRPERIEQMANARGWEAGGLLERVVYVRSGSASEQMETVRSMASRRATEGCERDVIDTLTRNLSVELPGRPNAPSRQGLLDVHLSEMARDAYLGGRAYLLTNRVTFGATGDISIGGRTVEQLVHAVVMLGREGGNTKATLMDTGESRVAGISARGLD